MRYLVSRLRRAAPSFTRNRRGAAMVEFAIIAIPFLILTLGTIEVALVTWANYELENATEDAGRRIRTGQVGNNGESALRTAICAQAAILRDCTQKLRINVENFQSFAGVTQPSPRDRDGKLRDSGFTFSPGAGGSIVLITTYYEYPLLSFVASLGYSDLASGNKLLQSSAVFRNEPFLAN